MKRSAGLALSVGQASLPLRLTIAIVLAAASTLCAGGGIVIASHPVTRAVAVLLVVPIGLIGVLASAFVLAPHSRFGSSLDRFVPRLREPRIAIATALVLWSSAFVLTV